MCVASWKAALSPPHPAGKESQHTVHSSDYSPPFTAQQLQLAVHSPSFTAHSHWCGDTFGHAAAVKAHRESSSCVAGILIPLALAIGQLAEEAEPGCKVS